MKMREAIRVLYTGKDAFSRQITLFSFCGIVGLFDAHFAINGLDTLIFGEKLIYAFLWIGFALYMIGYETKFLHERSVPDLDFLPIKLVFKSVLFWIFLVSVPFVSAKFYSELSAPIFISELLLAVPFTVIQAGYSYNYENRDAFFLLKKIDVSSYVALLIKRVWLVLCAYAIVFAIVFFVFFWGGVIFALVHGGEISEIGYIIAANQVLISKLSNFLSVILLTYLLSIITLIWDYELIKTYEREEE